jgi:hypothetical protein
LLAVVPRAVFDSRLYILLGIWVTRGIFYPGILRMRKRPKLIQDHLGATKVAQVPSAVSVGRKIPTVIPKKIWPNFAKDAHCRDDCSVPWLVDRDGVDVPGEVEHHVVAEAGVEDEAVGAAIAEQRVIADPAIERIGAAVAGHGVIADAAGEAVVAVRAGQLGDAVAAAEDLVVAASATPRWLALCAWCPLKKVTTRANLPTCPLAVVVVCMCAP